MKNKLMKMTVLMAVLCFALIQGMGAFAVSPYGIIYSGGEPLGEDNLIEDPELINSLSLLTKSGGDANINFNNAGHWEKVYSLNSEAGTCTPITAYRVYKSNPLNYFDNASYSISLGKYTLDVKIEGVTMEGALDYLEDNEAWLITIGSTGNISALRGGYYSDSSCTNLLENVKSSVTRNGFRVFIETNIKLYKHNSSEVFIADELYFGITDVDSGQSYKVLNDGNEITPERMFVKSVTMLQPLETELKNRYNADGHYLYSEHNENNSFDITGEGNDIYLKVDREAQAEGLNIVFGFVGSATSGVGYYGPQYKIQYLSDDNGVITGITSENVIANDNPSSSSTLPTIGYRLVAWTADVGVILNNGTTIRAGEQLTTQQIKQVVVDKNIVFTAVHATEPVIYSLSYDANGGKSAPATQSCTTVSESCSVNISSGVPTRDGYTFLGWADEKVATNADYGVGDEIVLNSDKTVYAIWEEIGGIIAPNTGASTEVKSATIITSSAFTLVVIIVVIKLLPRLHRRKVNFN